MSSEDEKVGRAVREYRTASKALDSKRRDLHALGTDLVRLGEWLLHYDHGQIAKEPLLDRLNVTEDVTLTMQVAYPPAQDVVEMVNAAHTLVGQVQRAKHDINTPPADAH